MADVWKSQGRKFCEICKVWFGDNRASIEFHERGKKHKDALAAKLRELSRASREKEKMQAQMSHALASMEAAALKAMRENGEGIEHGPALPSTGLASKIFDPRQLKDVGTMAREMAKLKQERQEMKIQKRVAPSLPSFTPKYLKREFPLPTEYLESHAVTKQEHLKSNDEIVWVEADAGDGRVYYYNMYTGESQWGKPNSFYTAEEYRKMQHVTELASPSMECCPSKTEVNSSVSTGSSTDVATPSIVENKGVNQLSIKSEQHDEDITGLPVDDIPLPEASVTDTTIKEELPLEQQEDSVTNLTTMPGSANEVGTCEITQPSLVESSEESYSLSSGPYGSWQRVKEENKQPIFSPLTAKYRAEEERERKRKESKEKRDEKMEPKLEFTEKTGAVLTKKVKGPIEFKKRSAAKSVRQRTE